MFQWFVNLFKPEPDPIEERLLELFGFLLNDHGFVYSKEDLGDAVDKNGKFSFCAPLNAYQFHNENVCITILHLVQRDDYNVYITDRKSTDQPYILSGTAVPSRLAYNLPLLAKEIQSSITTCGNLFGHPV